jgi:hypothetical protein
MLVDFNDIEPGYAPSESKFTPIPPGVYRACVNEATFGQSKSQKPMVTIEFVISEGSFKGHKQKRWFVVDSKARRAAFKQFLETMSSKPLETFDTEHLPKIIGKELLIRTNLESNGGFKNCVVKAFYNLADKTKAEADFDNDHDAVLPHDANVPF